MRDIDFAGTAQYLPGCGLLDPARMCVLLWDLELCDNENNENGSNDCGESFIVLIFCVIDWRRESQDGHSTE